MPEPEIIEHVLTAAREMGPASVALVLFAAAMVLGLGGLFTWGLQRLYKTSSSLDGHAEREEGILNLLMQNSNTQSTLIARMDERQERHEDLYERQTDTLTRLAEGMTELLVRSRIDTNVLMSHPVSKRKLATKRTPTKRAPRRTRR